MTTKTLIGVALTAALLSGCGGSDEPKQAGIAPEVFTDSLFAVMNSDRTNYTKLIVQRLGPNGVDAIKPLEHWQDVSNSAPLPAQMFRYGAEGVAQVTDNFSYSLQSLWPVNKQNAPKTDLEKEGLQYIADNPGEKFYGEETLGDTTYFTAVYPDVAVSPACTSCHNDHKDSPRSDFKIGDVMGGVVIRLPIPKG